MSYASPPHPTDATEAPGSLDAASPSAKPARELLVVCACCNFDSVKVIDQHVSEQLAQLGPVLYVDPPISRLTPRRHPNLAESLKGPRLREVAPDLWRLTPMVAPFPGRPWMLPVTRALVRRWIGRAARRLGLPVWCILSGWSDLSPFGAAGERLGVWWAQDDYAAAAEAGLIPGPAHRVARAEVTRARESDMIVAISPAISARWSSEGFDVVMVPNGTDPSAFIDVQAAEPATDVALPSPIAIVMGRFNRRTDPALLHAVVDRGVSLLLVGPDAGAPWLAPLASRPNVAWVGERPFHALPGYLALADVGLVPYADTAFNRASFPLKMLEYAGAALTTVVSELPAARWLDAEQEIVRITSGATEFADAVSEAVASVTPERQERCRALAREHGYESRALQLLDALNLGTGARGSAYWQAQANERRRLANLAR